MEFKNIEKKYRPVPFWSWNTKLDVQETARQIELMDEAGIGGYFMHARGGLTTEYMGKEWFDNVSVGIQEGNNRGMQAWVYDENGWPSGFGGGLINGLGEDYQQKYLRYDTDLHNMDRTICTRNGYRFFYEVNPFYVDVMDGKVTDQFIKKIYEPYYEKYQDQFQGFFTDEPQLSRDGIPWSLILVKEYEKEYGENLLECIDELFFSCGNYEDTRMKYWRLVTKLFSENYMKKLYDWCIAHDYEFTGHMVLEETLESQLTCNGACMPHYEYYTMPGMDWLGRDIFDCLTALQVASVAHQLGKKEVLSETFALCGHNVGMDELKAIYQWQMVQGITRLCQHLEPYSMAGLRKRDYPPAMYYQQPWWSEYGRFNEAVSRIGKILSEGTVSYDTLLLHNQTSGWKCFDNDKNKGIDEYNEALMNAYRILTQKHVLFHFGDEIIMERHAYVDGNTLVIGNQRYKTVVIPKNKGFFEHTENLLKEFKNAGGVITTAEEMAINDICSSSKIMYTERIFEDYKVYYFINNHSESIEVNFRQGGKVMNIETGEIFPFTGTYTFAPYDSLVLIDDGSPFTIENFNKEQETEILDLSGDWELIDFGQNVLTLDTCDVYFDDILVGKKENVVDILYMALELKRKVNIRLDFSFNVTDIPQECYLVCETPEKFKLTVNGKELKKDDVGYFVDTSFRKLSLEEMLIKGKNIILFEITLDPDQETYENLEKSYKFESEKNKLTFDTEIEPIYLIGDFSVDTNGTYKTLDKDAVRYHGDFNIATKKQEIKLKNIEQQGFPFFAGRITVRKSFFASHKNYILKLDKKGVNAVHIKVNNKDCGCLMWGHLTCDISSAMQEGNNVIELTLVNNLRNMLGPHHLPEGETWFACPQNFYKKGNVWTNGMDMPWNMDYCLVEFGIE